MKGCCQFKSSSSAEIMNNLCRRLLVLMNLSEEITQLLLYTRVV